VAKATPDIGPVAAGLKSRPFKTSAFSASKARPFKTVPFSASSKVPFCSMAVTARRRWADRAFEQNARVPSVAKATPDIGVVAAGLKSRPFKTVPFSASSKVPFCSAAVAARRPRADRAVKENAEIPAVAKATPDIGVVAAGLKSRPFKTVTSAAEAALIVRRLRHGGVGPIVHLSKTREFPRWLKPRRVLGRLRRD